MTRKSVAMLLGAALALAAAAPARAQSVRLQIDSRELYTGVPFILGLVAEGFAEEPQPEQPILEIADCKVTALGVHPNVSTSIAIINGRRSASHQVTFVFRYRVEATRAGRFEIPALSVFQSGKAASTRPSAFMVKEIAKSRDMRLRLTLPERQVWLGEVFDVTIDWYLARDPSDQSFHIPIFADEDWILVSAPPGDGQRKLAFPVADRELELPYSVDHENLDGVRYTRFRFNARLTPIKAGVLDLPPASVVANLQVGSTRDRFGFPSARVSMFKAEDKPRRLEVRQLPVKGRPASFDNAVGSAFSLSVSASNTVVRVGDPVELLVELRTDSPLEGLSLPKLDACGLPADLFDIADEPPVGELSDEGKAKLFRVTVRPRSAEARAIPALAFSYFDPVDATYKTVTSREISLSVEGSATVGAADVIGGRKSSDKRDDAFTDKHAHHLGATLSLSDTATTMRGVLSVDDIRPLLYLLYLLPLLFLAVRIWQVRTGDRRSFAGDLRRRAAAVDRAIAAAAASPAREAVPAIVNSLRALARATDPELLKSTTLLDELETHAFDPRAAAEPLPAALRERATELARAWRRSRAGASRVGAATLAILIVLLPAASWASDANATALGEARAAYAEALAERGDRDARARKFARAEVLFRALADEHADRPELLTDWGNAALGARDFGRATLAYRRALRLDANLPRARRNLAWTRANGPSWMPTASDKGALDSLFFWHHRMSTAQRHLTAAITFALMILLFAPWPRRQRLLRRLALVPLLVCVAMVASLLLQRDISGDVVVISDGAILRAADSVGAAPAQANPVPAGAEATLTEERHQWARVELADGTHGWLPSAAVVRVEP